MNLGWTARQIEAAWRLARREPDAMQGFDLSEDGFWNSFWAVLICFPGFLALGQPEGGPLAWLHATTGYAIGWAAFPLIMIPLSRYLDLGHRYVPLIVAANWASVLQTVLFVGTVTLGRVVSPPVGAIMILSATALVLLYQWLVVRTSLATTTGIAAGITALDLVVGLIIDGLFQT